MKRAPLIVAALLATLFFLLGSPVFGAGEAPPAGHGLDPAVLIGVALVLVMAKLGGELFERIGQPAVLGELCAGIFLGNLVIFGFTGAEPLKTNETIAALAELGVIILLFEVGLESDLREMIELAGRRCWSQFLVWSLLLFSAGEFLPTSYRKRLGWPTSSSAQH